ncbi:rRNA maturation RNase YbeY [Celeribacter ethanolicus]|uniref:Endoribonuclease YbeY n=1 Tax=Celeribacter ethanolicus TaxID=1758178 RepID=A0A291GFW2_9RHOB|nr:rRNA maturation RNase YbeY [Celeribacter ethanolicus]ATG49081.1 rRNA maturation RNase YbeY [Celeribacter ethanolicus]
MAVEVIFEDDRWDEAGLEVLVEAAEAATLAHLGLDAELCEGSVLACDDARIKVLNADFREKDKATNVLSWPAEERATPGERPPLPEPDFDGSIELGDIAIAYETCLREAEEQDKTFANHVTHLLVHGLLHLLGYDHITDRDAEIMEATEVEILATMGVKDPY